jgi:hypothetical protein
MIATRPSFALLCGLGLFVPVFVTGNGFAGTMLRQGRAIGDATLTPLSVLADAYDNRQSNLQVTQEGSITRILSDDTAGDRHQRVIVKLANNQTILVTHNVDLAPRIPNPTIGKTLRFCGEYEWNDEGGVIHWTHKDPGGRHVDGWLEYEGIRYCSLNSSNVILTGEPGVDASCPERAMNQAGFFFTTEAAFIDLRGKSIAHTSFGRSSGFYLKKVSNGRRQAGALFRK